MALPCRTGQNFTLSFNNNLITPDGLGPRHGHGREHESDGRHRGIDPGVIVVDNDQIRHDDGIRQYCDADAPRPAYFPGFVLFNFLIARLDGRDPFFEIAHNDLIIAPWPA